MIFVFGSNLKGVHGAGAAKFAYGKHGATWGYGEGRSGNSYALPTKLGPWGTMDLKQIAKSIETFIKYARLHPELEFKITQVGCGLGRFNKDQIAPLFADHEIGPNLYFDNAWREYLPDHTKFWGSF